MILVPYSANKDILSQFQWRLNGRRTNYLSKNLIHWFARAVFRRVKRATLDFEGSFGADSHGPENRGVQVGD